MKQSIIFIYFLFYLSSVNAIENITTVCEEPSFLKCTNTNKKECISSFKLSLSYCYKKYSSIFENEPLLKSDSENYKKCYTKSLQAYFNSNNINFNNCISKTKYIERLDELIKKYEK